MYNSLAFYYSGAHLKERLERSIEPQLQTQLQNFTNWLHAEHLQHQQWTSIVSQQYRQTNVWACNIFCDPEMVYTATDDFYIDFMPVTFRFSKLFPSQATYHPTYSIFPALTITSMFFSSLDVAISERNQENQRVFLALRPIKLDVRSSLTKFMAWFQFSKLYFSSFVQKTCLQEENSLSDSFSRCLIYKWLKAYYMTGQFKALRSPFFGPTQAEVLNHVNRLKEQMKSLKAISQSSLITQLNHTIGQWVTLWDVTIHWQTLRYCDDRLRRLLQRWAKRRHPNKGWGWVSHKYWPMGSQSPYFVFWLRLLTQSLRSSKFDSVFESKLKLNLMTLLQTQMRGCLPLETNSFQPCYFMCSESNLVLMSYSTVTLKKWRKSRAFDSFLLY